MKRLDTPSNLDKATLLHAADIAQTLVRLGEPGEIEETLRRLAATVSERNAPKGWAIRHVDGRWRTMDTIGMPDFTDDPAKALVCRLREHVDRYAADDPEDVRIVEVPW